jgi:hypothetical protein
VALHPSDWAVQASPDGLPAGTVLP